MAEFQEVMRQAKRMCEQSEGRCGDCPLQSIKNCAITSAPCFVDAETYKKIEHSVMDWAEKNPEPMYPTWLEWQEANFINASKPIQPCRFMNQDKLECDYHKSCDVCRSKPIPTDIAEKLGIKPIGGDADA